MGYRMRTKVAHGILYGFLFVVTIVTLFPFLTMLISSTHNNYRIATTFNILPGTHFMENYARLTQNLDIWRAMLNSAFLASTSTALGLYFTSLAAYAFSKISFKGKNIMFTMVLVFMMIPGQLSMIGFYKQMVDLRLINSYIPLILPSIAGSFSVFFFKQYLDGALPNEIIEAAIIDGCTEIRIHHVITLPLMVPALATQGVINFIGHWNSYVNPLIILNETKKMPIAPTIAAIKSGAGTADYGAQYVGILLSVLPIVIIFSFCSGLILDKVSIGSAIKG